jgi:hypothetical protein
MMELVVAPERPESSDEATVVHSMIVSRTERATSLCHEEPIRDAGAVACSLKQQREALLEASVSDLERCSLRAQ